jgi:hypothetical protein
MINQQTQATYQIGSHTCRTSEAKVRKRTKSVQTLDVHVPQQLPDKVLTTQGQTTDEISCPHCHKSIALLPQAESPRVEVEDESDVESVADELDTDPDYDPKTDSDFSDADTTDSDDEVIL